MIKFTIKKNVLLFPTRGKRHQVWKPKKVLWFVCFKSKNTPSFFLTSEADKGLFLRIPSHRRRGREIEAQKRDHFDG